ncbi:MAG: hypothetical protein CML66_18195 [Rhodobacteraceae bacterium]|nr:hypothetical protein [Paracoccaceae bacterium]MAY44918.1 hypothetical protein [Paracoccaceae bacterium]
MAENAERPSDEELLDFLSGRLSPIKAANIEARAVDDPDLAAEIALMRGVRGAMAVSENQTPPGELGWKRLERAMDAEQAPPRPAAQPTPIWRVAAVAAVAAVVTWQVVAVPFLGGRDTGYETASESPAPGVNLTVAFSPSATEEQIRTLLSQTGGRVTDGPSAIGLWQVSFDDEAARTAALETFTQGGGIVDLVQED